MKFVQESLIASALRSFFVCFCAVLGISLSFLVILLFMGGLFSGQKLIEPQFDLRVEANSQGSTEIVSSTKPVVLQLAIENVIGMGKLTQENVTRNLNASRSGPLKEDRVKAILLTINSPGGAVFDADSIYQAILEYKSRYKVPVYAYVDGLCASGGMYIACAADKIYASDVSLIGSVGVISEHYNVVDLLKKVGVTALTLTSGKYKDDLNPTRVWEPGEEERWKAISAYYYDRFVGIVTKARSKITKEMLVNEYGAQVFPAPLALEKGYIDYTGASRADALNALIKAAGITEEYQVVSMHEDGLFGGLFGKDNALLKGQIVHRIEGFPEAELANKPLYFYTP
ncbi:MAG: S49 family peptidase [Chlamydiota bacterium]